MCCCCRVKAADALDGNEEEVLCKSALLWALCACGGEQAAQRLTVIPCWSWALPEEAAIAEQHGAVKQGERLAAGRVDGDKHASAAVTRQLRQALAQGQLVAGIQATDGLVEEQGTRYANKFRSDLDAAALAARAPAACDVEHPVQVHGAACCHRGCSHIISGVRQAQARGQSHC